jgi:tetratricopeptide (TPR) repeat protein
MGSERSSLKRWQRIARYCLNSAPDNADAWIVLGHSQCRFGWLIRRPDKPHRHYEASKRAYRVAAKLKGDARTWINLGDACMYSGDLQGQFVAFRAALEINPTDAWALWRLGKTHSTAGENDDAILAFRRSLELLAGDEYGGWVYVDLGMNELCAGNEPEAISALLQAGSLAKGCAFDTYFPQIAETFEGHDKSAAELHDRLSKVNPVLATRFFTYFQRFCQGRPLRRIVPVT